MNSIRTRLFLILAAATTLVWLCAALWIYVDTRRELQQVLDARLMEAARMVASLVERGETGLDGRVGTPPAPTLPLDDRTGVYTRQLSCQIWSLDGRMIGRSSGAPDAALTDASSGFSDRIINGEPWRVYAVSAPQHNARVLVGDRLALRDRLVNDLLRGLVLPGLLVIPVLALLIWSNVGRGLRPLNQLTERLARRGPDDLGHIEAHDPPAEIRPVLHALNGLFDKVAAAREHERSFTAFAAHELRTPLAGLRAQAQIARLARDPETRDAALGQIETGVDRTARLVQQLLAMARLDATQVDPARQTIAIGAGIKDMTAAAPAVTPGVTTVIDPELAGMTICINRELFHLAIRNLHENALQHSPSGGTVRWRLWRHDGCSFLAVEDEGPGLAEDEASLVTGRFFRGRARSAVGSGLGLSIVEAALYQAGSQLALANRTDRSGLRALIALDALQVSNAV